MSDMLSYSVELAAEYSKQWEYLENRLPGLYRSLLKQQLETLGVKGSPSYCILDSVYSTKHDPREILAALIVSGYKYHSKRYYKKEDTHLDDSHLSEAIHMLDDEKDTPSKYVSIFKKLKEKMGYKTVDVFCTQDWQVEELYKLSRVDGDVCKIIDALAEVGYKLSNTHGGRRLTWEADLVSKLAKSDVDGFLNVFRKLKENLGYKSVGSNSVGQINDLLAISQILGYSGAIDYLAATGYKLKNTDLMRKDITPDVIREINYASDRLLKDALEDFVPCLYNGHPVRFIEYFVNLSIEDRKTAIRSIFNCGKVSNDHGVIEWLDKEYP
ncbi:hypothetical protein FJZ53_01705, partial [Candidatus Woesearchaeota archaeon]|nr:hypothetical protein [Candidatus Woesearchaeota archaeon]